MPYCLSLKGLSNHAYQTFEHSKELRAWPKETLKGPSQVKPRILNWVFAR